MILCMHAYACIMYNDGPRERNGWNFVSIKVQTELAIACAIIKCYFAINKPVLFKHAIFSSIDAIYNMVGFAMEGHI